jgi:hypothetical protein
MPQRVTRAAAWPGRAALRAGRGDDALMALEDLWI